MQKVIKNKWLMLFLIIVLCIGVFIAQHGVEMIGDFTQANPLEVFGYISAPAAIVCANENQYYYLTGNWVDPVISGFIVTADSLIYQGILTHNMIVNLSMSVSSDKNGTTITVGAKKNAVLSAGSEQSVYLKTANETQIITTNFVLNMAYNDNITLWIKHDYAPGTATLTANTLTTTLHALR